MEQHQTHSGHSHRHGPGCGHRTIVHGQHVDYLHDGHLHCVQGETTVERVIGATTDNPVTCTLGHECDGHPDDHTHGAGCGHEQVPHGDHVDHLVGGHLHHQHGRHCDHHGAVPAA